MMKLSILLLLILIESLVASTLLSVRGYAPSDVPNPMINPAACGRPGVTKSAVCDPAFLLSKESKDVIEGYINAVVGAQISVVVIDQMKADFIGSDEIELASEKVESGSFNFLNTLANS